MDLITYQWLNFIYSVLVKVKAAPMVQLLTQVLLWMLDLKIIFDFSSLINVPNTEINYSIMITDLLKWDCL